MMLRVFASIALVVAAMPACAEEAASAVHYASGSIPASFDGYVSRDSKGYELNGAHYDFAALIDALKASGAKAVLVQGLSTKEIQCAAILGMQSDSHVFVVDNGGKTKAVVWSSDAAGAAKADKACREVR